MPVSTKGLVSCRARAHLRGSTRGPRELPAVEPRDPSRLRRHAAGLRQAAGAAGERIAPSRPVDVNGIHKLAGAWYHLLYARVYGLSVSVLRLTNTYGPRMRVRDSRQTFLDTWIRQVLSGEELRVFGRR